MRHHTYNDLCVLYFMPEGPGIAVSACVAAELHIPIGKGSPARQVAEPRIWSCGCGRRPRRRYGWRSAAALRLGPRHRRGKRAAAEAAGSSRGLGGGRACSAAGSDVGWPLMVFMVERVAGRPRLVVVILG